jgi:hypothetical protein
MQFPNRWCFLRNQTGLTRYQTVAEHPVGGELLTAVFPSAGGQSFTLQSGRAA